MKNIFLSFIVLVLLGCSDAEKIKISGRAGSTITIPAKIDRIISAAPSNTEILVDLGLGDKLVAVDKYSADIPGVPSSIPKIDFFSPDAEAIINLNPDIIIANGINEVGEGSDPFRVLKESGITVVYIPTSQNIDAICEDIAFLAGIFKETEKGDAIIAELKNEIAQIVAISETIQPKKTVYFEISSPPSVVSIGNDVFLNEMITIAGAQNIFADKDRFIFPSAESIIERNPDVILTNVGNTLSNENAASELQNRIGFENIKAVKNNAVYEIDANSSSRPSHHIIFAIQQMARAIYPEYYAQ
jgi:iron complex transport system substrate-binding protein